MTPVLETVALSKRYGRRAALSDCTLSVPAGRVVGLVGPNGAGKTTLLHLAVGLLAPSAGTVQVLGGEPHARIAQIGFLPQEVPVYHRLSVSRHLNMGEWLNPTWDAQFARSRVADLGLDPKQRAGTLSGGQRAQLALTLAVAKRPKLLILDEPVASLDPLARREFLQTLMEIVAAREVSVVLSSHLIADLERVCDFLIVLVSGQVALSGDVETLLATHHRLTGRHREGRPLTPGGSVVEASHVHRQSTLLVRSEGPILDPAWVKAPVTLEDLVLAYLRQGRDETGAETTRLAVAR
jgi:ABC-2 type transport system ATP-binding protein